MGMPQGIAPGGGADWPQSLRLRQTIFMGSEAALVLDSLRYEQMVKTASNWVNYVIFNQNADSPTREKIGKIEG
jgi:hypothetical protein